MSKSENRRAMIRSGWPRWIMLWIPLMAAILFASVWLNFNAILGALIALLVGVFLYQRLVNKRSWRSIMWGVPVRDE